VEAVTDSEQSEREAEQAFLHAKVSAEQAYQAAVSSAERSYREAKASAEEAYNAATASASEWMALRIVALLLVVSAVSVFGLWTLSTYSVNGESLFAVYLSIDLVSFAMMAHVYGVAKSGDDFRRVPLLAGCFMLVFLVVVALAV
jgi:hypothetical protein